LDTVTFFHELASRFFLEYIVMFGPIVSTGFLIIDLCLHCHADAFLHDGVEEHEQLVTRQCRIFEQLAADFVEQFFTLLDSGEIWVFFEDLHNWGKQVEERLLKVDKLGEHLIDGNRFACFRLFDMLLLCVS